MPNMASCLLLYKLSCDVCQQLEAAQSAVYFIYHKIRQIGWHILVGVMANTLIARPRVWPWRGLKPQTQAPDASPSRQPQSPAPHENITYSISWASFWYRIKILLLLSELPYNNWHLTISLVATSCILEIGPRDRILCTLTILCVGCTLAAGYETSCIIVAPEYVVGHSTIYTCGGTP